MASGFIAINDLKVLCKGKTRFKTCKVTFRHEVPELSDKTVKLSELVNYTLTMHKGEVICFADGILQKPTIIKENKKEEKYYEPIELEPLYENMNTEEICIKREEMEEDYQHDKISWVNKLSKNERIRVGVQNGYDCDNAYMQERLTQEYPGFFIVDESTTYWKDELPSLEAISIEKRLNKQINGYKDKFGTFTRCCVLQEHNGEKFDDIEAIVIHELFGKVEILGKIEDLKNIFG